MSPRWFVRVFALVAASATTTAQIPDAPSVLAAARQALGGDATLNAVTSFTVDGSLTRFREPPPGDIAWTRSDDLYTRLDIRCLLPDKFVRGLRRSVSVNDSDVPIYAYHGFNGSLPFGTGGPARPTARDLAHIFVEHVLPLFATSFAVYPMDFTAAGRVQLATGLADTVDVRGPDEFTWRLFLDGASHLPIKLTWTDRPVVDRVLSPPSMFSSYSLPSFHPAELAPVEWELVIGDYRRKDGLNWPHRLTTSMGGRKHDEVRLGTFKINPKVDPRQFSGAYLRSNPF